MDARHARWARSRLWVARRSVRVGLVRLRHWIQESRNRPGGSGQVRPLVRPVFRVPLLLLPFSAVSAAVPTSLQEALAVATAFDSGFRVPAQTVTAPQ